MHFPNKDSDFFSSERGRGAAPLHEHQQSVRTSPRDQRQFLQRTIDSVLDLIDLDDFEECNNDRPNVSDNTKNQPGKTARQHPPGQ